MGASDSKLVFKKGIFRLSEERNIAANDPYWTSFWDLPESPEDVFSLFSPADIRRTRDAALENLETLLLAVTSRLFRLRHHPSFPDPELAPERELLNCIRVLTRVLPYIYERPELAGWEDRFFWGQRRRRSRTVPGGRVEPDVLFDGTAPGAEPASGERPDGDVAFEDAKPLAEELIDTLTDLLFYSDFTVARQPHNKPKVSYAIWQSGVGCNTTVPTTKEFESNRCEILRLLLTLASLSMYTPPGALPSQGIRTLTYMCTSPDKQVVLSLLCSLLNTTVKYNPAGWRMPYNTLVFKDTRQSVVSYALQLLLVLILYPVPEQNGLPRPKNAYRHFLGRLHRPADFQFLVEGMGRILNQPLQATASYLPGTQSSVKFAPEILMLFWEMTQCNKRFRAYLIDTQRVHDFVVLILFYALECKNDASRQGVVRMCAFLLQTLSVEKNFGLNLNKAFEGQGSLPPVVRIPHFHGTYADFLIQSVYNLITTSQSRLTAIYPALLAVINNISAYVDKLSMRTCSRLMQLFNSMCSPSFLLANETNHSLLRSLLEALNTTIEHRYKENPYLVYSILKNRRRFEALRTFTLESGQEEMARWALRRKASSGEGGGDESTRSSVDSLRSSTKSQHHRGAHSHQNSHSQPRALREVAEDEAFAIGDDEDDEGDDADHDHDHGKKKDEDGDGDSEDGEPQPTPSQSSLSEYPSRASSVVSVEDAVPTQLRGMSEKARGKLPAGTPIFSRQKSMQTMSTTTTTGGASGGGSSGESDSGHLGDYSSGGGGLGIGGSPGGGGSGFQPTSRWIDSWLPELPLHTILTLIQQLSALLPREALQAAPGSPAAATAAPATAAAAVAADSTAGFPTPETLQRIQTADLVGIEASAVRVHSFEWTPLALGWYESLLWSLIFSNEMQVAKGSTVGVWNGTAIKLFRVQETAAQGPSLTSPRGAVDAVGSNLVSRIGQINLRGGGGSGGGSGGGGGGGNGGSS